MSCRSYARRLATLTFLFGSAVTLAACTPGTLIGDGGGSGGGAGVSGSSGGGSGGDAGAGGIGGSSGGVCGDGTCDANEDCAGCAGDCGVCPDPPWSFFVSSDSRNQPAILEQNVRSMVALDSGAVAFFNGGDITATGTVAEWDDHHNAFALGAPDPTVPADPSGINRQSLIRTDVSDFGLGIRYVAAFGNHDDGSAGWFNHWNTYLPGQQNLGRNDTGGIYFMLTHENAVFFILDSVHPSVEQTTWLQDSLQTPEALAATWRFALFHHPVYPCNYKTPFGPGIEWVEIFEQYNFDIIMVAHSHTYERTCHMRGGSCAADGPIYLNSSGAAAPIRVVDPTKTATVSSGGRSDSYDCAEILTSYGSSWYHFCHFLIDGDRLDLGCYSHDNIAVVFDSLTLTKSASSASCGDGTCDASETCAVCPADCTGCPPAPLRYRVQSGTDDAEERGNTTMYLNSSDLELVTDTADIQQVGLRFVGVQVPPGATVASASLIFTTDETNTEATDLVIRAQAADDAPTFGPTDGDISSRPLTSASTAWSPPAWSQIGASGSDQTTPNLAVVIQEVVDRPGWTAGNSLAIIITGSGNRTAEAYEGSSASAPLLEITLQ